MNSKLEKLENNKVRLTFDVSAERFEEGMKFSYNKNKGKLNLPGFRKGKAPRALIEKQFGAEVFMDDAINFVFPDAYDEAAKEQNIEPVSRPELESTDYDKEKGVTLVVNVVVKPEVTLGDYKGLTYNDYDVDVTDEEVETEIGQEREKNARIVSISDRPIQSGDTAIIDFEGFVDDVAFEGGKGEDYELVIGSHTFIDTFEDQLIGKSIGDDIDVNVTFPEDYGKEDLAGKPALFKVEIKDITTKELPELDDDFAQDVSDFDTIDEYKKDVKDKLLHQKEHQKEHAVEDELIQKASENAQVDVPVEMVETQMNQMLQEFANRVSQQGLDFNTFLKYSGQTAEAFREQYRETAGSNVRARLVLEAIAKQENIQPSEDEIQEEIKRIANAYGIEEDKMRGLLRPEDLSGLEVDLKTQKALQLIVDNAKGEKVAKEA